MNFRTSLFKASIFLVVVLLFASSCKKDKATPMGTLLTYTNIPASEYDRIEVYVGGQMKGALTQPYIIKPSCGDQGSAYNLAIQLPVGEHIIYAIQFKDGKNVGEWSETTRDIKEDKCAYINWVD